MKRQVEYWAKEEKTPVWLFMAAKRHHKWARGQELTLQDFKAALKAASNINLKG